MHALLLAAENAPGAVPQDGFMTQYMWLVPLLPVLSFFAILFFGK
jgi:hypothetical protein